MPPRGRRAPLELPDLLGRSDHDWNRESMRARDQFSREGREKPREDWNRPHAIGTGMAVG